MVAALIAAGKDGIIVIDDGSGARYGDIFHQLAALPAVEVIYHPVNLGKGAALKSGMAHAKSKFPDLVGVVTADADGQHHADDILKVVNALLLDRSALVLGVRTFSDASIPLRSRFGNTLTRGIVRIVIGQRVSDSQTGLRGVPAQLIPTLLRMKSARYEFELAMLIACKHLAVAIHELPIQTIYIDGNRASHFSPLLDSTLIYFLLLRFAALSGLTAVLDNALFAVIYSHSRIIWKAQLVARLVAMTFNYAGARRAVFHYKGADVAVLPKYVLLVALNATLSYGLLRYLHSVTHIPVITAKLAVETVLFFGNFVFQRDFVFTRRSSRLTITKETATNWDRICLPRDVAA